MTTPTGNSDAKRPQVEKTIQESDVLYRLFTETIQDVIWTMDLDGHFTYVSPSVFQLRGYTAEEAMQQSVQEAFTSDSAVRILVSIQILLAQNETQNVHTSWELRQTCKDGSTVWTEVSAKIICDKQGTAYAVLGVSRDTTERKIAEDKIAEQAHLLDIALDPIILRDMNEALIFWNKAAENLYGWTFEEAKSLKVSQFIAEVDQPKYERGIKEFLEKGEC